MEKNGDFMVEYYSISVFKGRTMKKAILLFLITATLGFAQSEEINLSGSLLNDTQFILSELSDSNSSFKLNISHDYKKPFLAGIMSFALPGAGQIYTENYLKAGIYAGLEIGAIVLAVVYNNKGDDQTDFFENYANQNWSVERYARWTVANISTLNPSLTEGIDEFKIFNNEGNVVWSELNRLEDAIGGYYSHKLAPLGDQQYYEMIGKYPQFNVGWIEFGDDVNKPFSYETEVVEQFKYYSKERGKANDFYNVSKWAVIAVVSNHVISAFDAAWSASKYNKKLNFNISIEEETIGYYKDYYPQLNISYKF